MVDYINNRVRKERNKKAVTLAALLFIGIGGFLAALVMIFQEENNRQEFKTKYNQVIDYSINKLEGYKNKN